MKKITGLLIACIIVLASCNKPNLKVKLSNEADTISYFVGVLMAKNFKNNSGMVKMNPNAVARAFNEVFEGDSIKFTDQLMSMKLDSYFNKLQTKINETNLKEGQAFLEKNKKNPAVITLPSGLQYQVLKEGTGPKPDSSDMISVNYTISLINGEKFDSSVGRGPAKFPVVGWIKGWTEAALRMNIGSKWKIVLPSQLAFGEQGYRGSKIKPNMAIILEVEMLSIEPKAKEQPKMQPRPQLKIK